MLMLHLHLHLHLLLQLRAGLVVMALWMACGLAHGLPVPFWIASDIPVGYTPCELATQLVNNMASTKPPGRDGHHIHTYTFGGVSGGPGVPIGARTCAGNMPDVFPDSAYRTGRFQTYVYRYDWFVSQFGSGWSYGGAYRLSMYKRGCPAHSTLTGTTCVCAAGFTEDPQASACVAPASSQAQASLALGAPTDPNCTNPINGASGNKYQREVDVPPPTADSPLIFERHYNAGLGRARSLGRSWQHSYDRVLVAAGVEEGVTAYLLRPDGRWLGFVRTASRCAAMCGSATCRWPSSSTTPRARRRRRCSASKLINSTPRTPRATSKAAWSGAGTTPTPSAARHPTRTPIATSARPSSTFASPGRSTEASSKS